MHATLYDPNTPKKATNLSINGDLLRQAKALEINLSKTLEDTLISVLQQKKRELWLQQNHEAVEAYNAHIERDGVFSDGIRSF